MSLVHELTGGNPREITSFVGRFIGMRHGHPNTDPMVTIRSAHLQPSREEIRMQEDMGLTDKKKRREKGSKKNEKDGKDKNKKVA